MSLNSCQSMSFSPWATRQTAEPADAAINRAPHPVCASGPIHGPIEASMPPSTTSKIWMAFMPTTK